MADREVDAFSDLAMEAQRASQDELMAEAMGATLPEGEAHEDEGDRSLEAMGEGPEGRGHEEEEGEEIEGEGAPEGAAAAPERDGKTGQFAGKGNRHEAGILGELKKEREARQALAEEVRLLREAKPAAAAPQAHPAPAAAQPQPAQAVSADPEPDMFLEPEAYRAWQGREMDRRAQAAVDRVDAVRVRGSFQEAGRQHGQAFQDAYAAADALGGTPQGAALLNHVRQSHNPGQALVDWHKANLAAREIGNDPAAYQAKVEADLRAKLLADPEFRKQIIAGARGGSQGQGSPGNTIQMPPSLNGAQGGSSRRAGSGAVDTSQRGMFNEAIAGL